MTDGKNLPALPGGFGPETKGLANYANQTSNTVDGDMAGAHIFKNKGDVNHIEQAVILPAAVVETPLKRLYKKLNDEVSDDQYLTDYIEDIQIFTRIVRHEKLSDLDEKLTISGRIDEIEMAKEMKEWVYRELRKNLFSQTFQQIYSILLGKVYEEFNHHVKPKVLSGAPRDEIDQIIKNYVVDPISKELDECPEFCASSPTLVRRMIYFLAGNCHIYWRAQ